MLAAAFVLAAPVAFAQTDSSGASMSEKSMSDTTMMQKKPMAKPHGKMKPKSHSGAVKRGETQKSM